MSLIEKKNRQNEQKKVLEETLEPQEWDFPSFENDSSDRNEFDLSVTAISGASCETFQIAGQTVVHARNFLGPVLNVDDEADALVNGQQADKDYVLQKGDRLEFVKKAGEKG
jgi:hypothetical protein